MPIIGSLHYIFLLKKMSPLNIYILTFNCARNLAPVDLLSKSFFHALPESGSSSSPPEVLFLSLQEFAPIAPAFLGGSHVVPYFEAFRRTVDAAVENRWDGGAITYKEITAGHCGMTGLMVYARSDVAEKVAWIETAQVGVGWQEMGNKGALGVRLGYLGEGGRKKSSRRRDDNAEEETEESTIKLTFVAAHLAAAEDEWRRRNQDWRNIVKRLVFTRDPSRSESMVIGRNQNRDDQDESAALLGGDEYRSQTGIFEPGSHLFFAGDLNYRTSDLPPSLAQRERFPKPTAPEGSINHYSALLKLDQLTREKNASRTLNGLCEAPIKFPPTYKYSTTSQIAAAVESNSSEEWNWTKRRWPSWCDRILYLDVPASLRSKIGGIQTHGYDALPLLPTSDHRPVALSVSVPSMPLTQSSIPEDDNQEDNDIRLSPPFPIDPNWENRRAAARTRELAVGSLAFLGTTKEGNILLLAIGLGILGSWFMYSAIWGA